MSTQLRSLQSLYKANQKASLHQERLSTGKRVNSAQDDLASFSIANNIKTSKKGAETALQSISNAKSILSIVEAGQQKQVELLQEIKAKIIQLKDPSLNNNQRQSISESINSLKAEIANVGTQLKFNGRSLVGEGSSYKNVNSAIKNKVLQVGSDINGATAEDLSGFSVSLNDKGDRLAVGSPGWVGPSSAKGNAKVFEETTVNGTHQWSQLGSDIEGDAADNDFGYSIDINSAGDRVVVGAVHNDANGEDSGHVKVLTWNGTSWAQLGSDIVGEEAHEQFGYSISTNSDGTRIAVGARFSGNLNNGAARMYSLSDISGNPSWIKMGSDIVGDDAYDGLGASIAMNADGNIVAIGALQADDNGTDSGQVKVYSWNGTSWAQLGSDINGDAAGDEMGNAVALNDNGNILAIGAFKHNSWDGQVKVYSWNGTSWAQLGSDIEENLGAGESLGFSVSLSGNGKRLAIGSIYADDINTNAGKARVYENEYDRWKLVQNEINGELAHEEFGSSVSLNENGDRLAVGAKYNNANGSRSGKTEVYDLEPVSTIKFQVGDGVQETLTYNGVAITDSSSIVIEFDSNYDTNDSNITQLQELIEGMINQVSNTGSFLERLDHKEDIMRTRVQGLEQIRSTYEDADFAKEQIELMKVQILQQTATAALAQANSAPQSVLSLFR